ncbi:MAG: LysM peptidoglycan-binding domain-containing protein, partial [Anderseniella sp.]
QKGARKIELREITRSGKVVSSQQSIALTVPEGDQTKPLIVLSETAKPSKVLQKPTLAETTPTPTPTVIAEPDKVASSATTQEVPQTTTETATETAETNVKQEPETKPTANSGATIAPAPAPATAPAPQRSLNVEVVDYDEQGRTTFSGSSTPGATVRVYVDSKFVGEAIADGAGSWALAATDKIEPGSHTLRTDQVASNGSVSERIELPFYRESSERIASLQAQRESQTNQPATTDPTPTPAPATTSDITQGSKQTAEPVEAPVNQSGTEPAQTATTQTAATDTTATPDSAVAETGKVVIQPGNNLWQISRVIYGEGVQYTVIYEANKAQIRNPNLIYPGQIFETPGMNGPESIDPSCRKSVTECQ